MSILVIIRFPHVLQYDICFRTGIDIRGDMNIIRNNNVKGASGAGLGLGGVKTAIHQYGTFNQVIM